MPAPSKKHSSTRPNNGLEVGSRLWIPCDKQVWRPGVVVGSKDELVNECLQRRAIVEVEDDNGREEVVIDVQAAGPKGGPSYLLRSGELLTQEDANGVEDLSLLPMLAEPEILRALYMRYMGHHIYTFAGPMLLAVNPYQKVPGLYDNEQLMKFSSLPSGCPSPMPHVFGIARDAYLGIQQSDVSQTVLVSGESGAGKTENAKFVIRFLALASGRKPKENEVTMERRVLECVPLLEALGNARTLKNDNSSRFGKFTELQFQSVPDVFGPCIMDAQTHTYLLETVRVTELNEGERCFHVFYQILAAAARIRHPRAVSSFADKFSPRTGIPKEPSKVCLPKIAGLEHLVSHQCTPRDFAFLARSTHEVLSGIDEAVEFDRTIDAMRAFRMTDGEIEEVLNTIIAVLHLGNIKFRSIDGNSEASEIVDGCRLAGPLCLASNLLGVDSEDLATSLCTRSLQVHEKSTKQVIRTSRTRSQSEVCRDALARHLYGMVFKYILSRINTEMAGRGAGSGVDSQKSAFFPTIGVLDIFGFEVFDHNGFEQLCINFANEMLQQHFNTVVFEYELELYKDEGIRAEDEVALNATVPQQHLRDSVVRSGLFPMLDEECNISNGTYESWLNKVGKRYGNSNVFELMPLKKGHFMLHHFAGPVVYCADAFLEKNRDTLSPEGLECMQGSSKLVLQKQAINHGRTWGSRLCESSGRVLRAKVHSVSSEFRDQLDQLMQTIQATQSHFIRCIRPNQHALPNSFECPSALEQLRYQGVLEAIRVARAGYAFRLVHAQAVATYCTLAPRSLRQQLEQLMINKMYHEASLRLFAYLKETLSGITASGIQVGKSLTFFKTEATEVLGLHVRAHQISAAIQVQAAWQMMRNARSFKAIRKAVTRLQRVERGRKPRGEYLKTKRAAMTLQAYAKGREQRGRFQQTVKTVIHLQRWFRKRMVAKKKYLSVVNERVQQASTDQHPSFGLYTRQADTNTARSASEMRIDHITNVVGKEGSINPMPTRGSNQRVRAMPSPCSERVQRVQSARAAPGDAVSSSLVLEDQINHLQESVQALKSRMAGYEDRAPLIATHTALKEEHLNLQTNLMTQVTTAKDEVSTLSSNMLALQAKMNELLLLEHTVSGMQGSLKQVQEDSAQKEHTLKTMAEEQEQASMLVMSLDSANKNIETQTAAVREDQERIEAHLQEQMLERIDEMSTLGSNVLALQAKVEQLVAVEQVVLQVSKEVNQVKADSAQQQEFLTNLAEKHEETHLNMMCLDGAASTAKEQLHAQLMDEHQTLQADLRSQLASVREEVSNLSASFLELVERSDHQTPMFGLQAQQLSDLERMVLEVRGEVQRVQTDTAERKSFLSSLFQEQERTGLQMRSMDAAISAANEQAEAHQAYLRQEHKALQETLQMQLNTIKTEVLSSVQQSETDTASVKSRFEQFEEFVKSKLNLLDQSIEELHSHDPEGQTASAGQHQQLEQSVQAWQASFSEAVDSGIRDMFDEHCASMTGHLEGFRSDVDERDKYVAQFFKDLEPKLNSFAGKQELEYFQQEITGLLIKQQGIVDQHAAVTKACQDMKAQITSMFEAQRDEHAASVAAVREEVAVKIESAVTAVKQDFDTVQGAARSMDVEPEEYRKEHMAQLAALREEMASSISAAVTSFREDLDRSRALVGKRQTACDKRQEALEADLTAYSKEQASWMAGLRQEMMSSISTAMSALRGDLDKTHKAAEALDSRQEFEASLLAQREAHEASMAALREEMMSSIGIAVSKLSVDLDKAPRPVEGSYNCKEDFEVALLEQRNAHMESIAVLRQEMESSISNVMSTLRDAFDTASKPAEGSYSRQEDFEAALGAQRKEQVAWIATLREEMMSSISTAVSSLRENLDKDPKLAEASDSLQKKFEAALLAQREAHASSITALREEMSNSISAVMSTMHDTLDAASNNAEGSDKSRDELKAEFGAQRKEQAAWLAAVREEMMSSISTLREDLDTALKPAEVSSWRQEDFEAALQAQHEAHRASIAALREEMTSTISTAMSTLRNASDAAHGPTESSQKSQEEEKAQQHEELLAALRAETTSVLESALSALRDDLNRLRAVAERTEHRRDESLRQQRGQSFTPKMSSSPNSELNTTPGAASPTPVWPALRPGHLSVPMSSRATLGSPSVSSRTPMSPGPERLFSQPQPARSSLPTRSIGVASQLTQNLSGLQMRITSDASGAPPPSLLPPPVGDRISALAASLPKQHTNASHASSPRTPVAAIPAPIIRPPSGAVPTSASASAVSLNPASSRPSVAAPSTGAVSARTSLVKPPATNTTMAIVSKSPRTSSSKPNWIEQRMKTAGIHVPQTMQKVQSASLRPHERAKSPQLQVPVSQSVRIGVSAARPSLSPRMQTARWGPGEKSGAARLHSSRVQSVQVPSVQVPPDPASLRIHSPVRQAEPTRMPSQPAPLDRTRIQSPVLQLESTRMPSQPVPPDRTRIQSPVRQSDVSRMPSQPMMPPDRRGMHSPAPQADMSRKPSQVQLLSPSDAAGSPVVQPQMLPAVQRLQSAPQQFLQETGLPNAGRQSPVNVRSPATPKSGIISIESTVCNVDEFDEAAQWQTMQRYQLQRGRAPSGPRTTGSGAARQSSSRTRIVVEPDTIVEVRRTNGTTRVLI